jgi:hypothetical protein
MSKPAIRPQSSSRQAAADSINRALAKSDIAEICHAIGAATRLYNISDLALKSCEAEPSSCVCRRSKKNKLHDCFECSRRDGHAVACHGASGRSHKISALEISCELPSV